MRLSFVSRLSAILVLDVISVSLFSVAFSLFDADGVPSPLPTFDVHETSDDALAHNDRSNAIAIILSFNI